MVKAERGNTEDLYHEGTGSEKEEYRTLFGMHDVQGPLYMTIGRKESPSTFQYGQFYETLHTR